MELLKILNHCHHHRGFVYQNVRFGADNKSIEGYVEPPTGKTSQHVDQAMRSVRKTECCEQ